MVFTFYDYSKYKEQRLNNAHSIGRSTAQDTKEYLDSIFTISNDAANKLAVQFTATYHSEKETRNLIQAEVNRMPFLLGITVAYEPYSIDPEKEFYSVFYNNRKSSFYKIEDMYNYHDSSLITAKWYTQTAITKKPYLSNPYFAEVAKELVIDYSTPLFSTDNDQSKRFIGVVTLSISLDLFTEVVSSYVHGKSGFVFITEQGGEFITHPNRSYILNENIYNQLNNVTIEGSAKKNYAKPSGHINFTSNYTGVQSILYHQTSDITNWKIGVVYSRTDLLGSPKNLERKIIHIALAISILILFVLIVLIKKYFKHSNNFWAISIIISVLFLLNVSVIWIINLDLDYSEELTDRTRVYSDNALKSYVDKKNNEQRLLGKPDYLTIPTGTFIEELLVTDSYNMSVSGKIWQKWPVEHDLKDNKGFHFIQAAPNGRSVLVELLSKDRLDSATWLYTWKFNATLRIFFDYRQYPLDQHYIDIKLIYPDMTDKIMLVPDFESYEALNPSSRPGMSDIIFLPRHRIIASYFSFSSLDMKTFFGQDRVDKNSEFQLLEYVIVIKRRFITPFISFVIPFILGSIIIFFLLYSLNKNKDDKSGVTVMGVVQGMAALFFAMLLAHITIRNKIPTPHITYLETFYIVNYIMTILLILVVVMYSGPTKYKFLDYKDNLLVKVIYWPFLFGLIYVITLIKFY